MAQELAAKMLRQARFGSARCRFGVGLGSGEPRPGALVPQRLSGPEATRSGGGRSRAFAAGVLLALLLGGSDAGAAPAIAECKGALTPSVVGGCGAVTSTGCCDLLGRSLWCQGKDLYCVDCTQGFAACGWSPLGFYDCGQEAGSVDPTGVAPVSCDPCPPECGAGASCSPTCAGKCGKCPGKDDICLDDGTCYTPQCQGKTCGADPLGFSCGSCKGGEVCVDGLFVCQAPPKGCGPRPAAGCDGCACESCVCDAYPTCCTDSWDTFCAAACEVSCGMDCSPCPAVPSCDGLECGQYCGVDCGICGAGHVCVDMKCCETQCGGKECGSDGCGGSCGTCQGYDTCEAGLCVACQPKCPGGAVCGDDGCGGTCGECGDGEKCVLGQCLACAPSCDGKHCGDDGCGGVCGTCLEGQSCEAGECKGCGVLDWVGCCDGEVSRWCQSGEAQAETCDGGCGWSPAGFYDCGFGGEDPSGAHLKQCGACKASCEGRTCGSDGCGGSCGECASGLVCEQGQCAASGCEEISAVGCCEGGALTYCSGAVLAGYGCAGASCGWDPAGRGGAGWYDCGFSGSDPSGEHPRACGTCEPDCGGRVCGGDGCGGSCGECPPGEVCSSGACATGCEPQCEGRECGPDGCGGVCGTCDASEECTAEGLCEGPCEGGCDAGLSCGPGGCDAGCDACDPVDAGGCGPSGCSAPCDGCGVSDAGCDGTGCGAGTSSQPAADPGGSGCGSAPDGARPDASLPLMIMMLLAVGSCWPGRHSRSRRRGREAP